jgi:hypothetical protein
MQISQEELEERADLHRNYVGGVERGEWDIGITALDGRFLRCSRHDPRCPIPSLASRAVSGNSSNDPAAGIAENRVRKIVIQFVI